MTFLSLHHVSQKNTWAVTVFFIWICSFGIIINNTGGRTDIFFTFGIMPLAFGFSIGLTHW